MARDIFAHLASIDSLVSSGGEEATLAGAASAGHGAGFMSTRPNVFGGFDVLDNGVPVASSMPNVFGGFDIHGHLTSDT